MDTEDLIDAIDGYWLMVTAPIVFLMQMGFLMLETGSVRVKNTKNILLKNTVDVCITALIWWGVGFPFAFGGEFEEDDDDFNGFVGYKYFFSTDFNNLNQYAFFFFQWTFANTAVTILSGAVAERIRFEAWIIVGIWVAMFVYPFPAHWVWHRGGFLNEDFGVVDFAGSGVVHITGGAAAFVGAAIIGPREGRFVDGSVVEIPGHSIALSVLGTLTLWFCWFAFNCGSTLGLTGDLFIQASLASANTMMAPIAAALVSASYHKLRFRRYDLPKIMNAILAGLVAISGPSAVVEPEDAVVIGVFAVVFYEGLSNLVIFLKIDDVLDAAAVHLGGGIWGVISVGLWSHESSLQDVRARSNSSSFEGDFGLLRGGGWFTLGVQLLEIVVIVAWSAGLAAIVFGALKLAKILRVDKYTEEKGLDRSNHAGYAYTNIQVKVSDYVSVRRDIFV